jgi:hypothetical protein
MDEFFLAADISFHGQQIAAGFAVREDRRGPCCLANGGDDPYRAKAAMAPT